MSSPISDSSSPGSIHPSSVIAPKARLGRNVAIGPFCSIGPDVVLGDDVQLQSHVAVSGDTSIGPGARIYPFASIGHAPQDLKYRGEPSKLVIGSHCTIREGVTINPGTQSGGLLTSIGDHCTILANAHVAHDCKVGDHVILVNNVMLAGHCQIGSFAILGGGSAVHQFVRIGTHAMIGGLAGVENDVIPYGMALGNRASLAGLNLVGLRRRNFSRDAIHDLRRAYRLLFAMEGTLKERVEDVAAEFATHEQVHEILDFLREGGDRAICLPRESRDAAP